MKTVLSVTRIIVGVLFIFSGLIKANDPMGLSYKMQEFFEVWGFHFFNDFSLGFALIMNTFEIVAGVAVLIGWRMRSISWLLLLLIIFFTFLTGYALLSGNIKTCGCFGDCIPLTPLHSFIKDIVLTVLILIIFIKRNSIYPAFGRFGNSFLIILSTLFCIIFQWYVLTHLPVLDCLPYKKGNNLVEQMKLPEGAVADSFVYKFKYKKDGKEVLFGDEDFPEDFDEKTYTFIDREKQLVRKGTASAAINDFELKGANGDDSTLAILNQPGYYIMLFIKDANEAERDWPQNARSIHSEAIKKNVPFYIVTPTVEAAQKQLAATEGIQFLNADATAIKTAARVNPTYFIMKGSTVAAKYANADFDKVIATMK